MKLFSSLQRLQQVCLAQPDPCQSPLSGMLSYVPLWLVKNQSNVVRLWCFLRVSFPGPREELLNCNWLSLTIWWHLVVTSGPSNNEPVAAPSILGICFVLLLFLYTAGVQLLSHHFSENSWALASTFCSGKISRWDVQEWSFSDVFPGVSGGKNQKE